MRLASQSTIQIMILGTRRNGNLYLNCSKNLSCRLSALVRLTVFIEIEPLITVFILRKLVIVLSETGITCQFKYCTGIVRRLTSLHNRQAIPIVE